MSDLTDSSNRQRKAMGPIRLALVALLLLAILVFEYDWLTTPWWQKAQRLCGSIGSFDLIGDLQRQFGW